MKVNDILVSKWGYEQTNITFYQVVKVTMKTATIRKISTRQSDNFHMMTGLCVPMRDQFIGEPIRRKIQHLNGEQIFITEYEIARPWKGNLERYTTYA